MISTRNKRHPRLEVKWIDPQKLIVDAGYQRGFKQAWGDHIVAEFDENQVRPLDVVDRGDGTFAVENGQHTLHALIQKGWQSVPCFVRNGSTSIADEAEHFIRGNSNSKPLSQIEMFSAALTAGRPKQVAIAKILRSFDLTVSNAGTKNSVRAVRAVERIYDMAGPAGVKEVFAVVLNAWTEDDTGRFSAYVLLGIDVFLRNHPTANRDKLISRLKTVEPITLTRQAKSIAGSVGVGYRSTPGAVSLVIERLYRKRGK